LDQVGLWEFNWLMVMAEAWGSQVIRLILGLGLFRLDMFNMLLNSLARLWQLGLHLRRYVRVFGNFRVLTNCLGSSTRS
jgi:hypothetical protein